MAKQVFENKDLVCLIYSFDTEHRERMKHVCHRILYPEVVRKDKNCVKSLLTTVPNVLKHHRDWDKLVQFFVLKRCFCCSRHSYRKPNLWIKDGDLVIGEDRSWVPECKNRNDCQCHCRRVCRYIVDYLVYVT